MVLLKRNPITTEQDFDHCPICGEEYISSCRCFRSDRECKNGHEWHNCVIHNKIVIGSSDHSLPTMTCTCNGTGVE